MSNWAVGDLAVCVDATPHSRCPRQSLPITKGTVYTVESVDADEDCDGDIGLRLVEAPIEPIMTDDYNWANSFAVWRFRKVDKREACETEFVTLLQRIKRKQVA